MGAIFDESKIAQFESRFSIGVRGDNLSVQKIKDRITKVFLLVFLLVGASISAYADDSSATASYTFSDVFTITNPDSDMSIRMLQMLFGNVGNSLTFTSSSGDSIAAPSNAVTENLFNIFNTGVLTMVMLLVAYSVAFQAITISQDGNQGMSKQSSVFLTFRIVVGSGLPLS